MATAHEVKVLLTYKERKGNDGNTWEALNGYALLRGKPIYKAQGKKISDSKPKTTLEGVVYTYPRWMVNFYATDEASSKFEDEVLILKGREFDSGDIKLSVDYHMFEGAGEGVDAEGKQKPLYKNGFSPRLLGLSVPLTGKIGKKTVIDSFGDEVTLITLSFSEKDYLKLKKPERYTIFDSVQISDEDLDNIAKGFKFFNKHMEVFNGEKDNSPKQAAPAL